MDSLFSFPVGLFHPLQHAGLSRRTPSCRPTVPVCAKENSKSIFRYRVHFDSGRDKIVPLMPEPVGTRFGAYEILSLIGAGGMGVVYQARDTRLDRLVALKFLPSQLSGNPEQKRQLIQEARAAAAL